MSQVERQARILAVSRNRSHAFSKRNEMSVRLLAGLGVEGDAHMGVTVKHRSHVQRDPTAPNLRQVHLIHAELFDELAAAGFRVHPGELGENITTSGVALLGLPAGTRLRLGGQALIELTGLRNPCSQIERFQPGLFAQVIGRDAQDLPVRKSGVMAIVIEGGDIVAGDAIETILPEGPHHPLERV